MKSSSLKFAKFILDVFEQFYSLFYSMISNPYALKYVNLKDLSLNLKS